MATTQQQPQAHSAAFLTRALESFCAEVSETFNVSMASIVHTPYQLAAEEIEASLKIFSAMITVTVSGDVSGDCYMLFDKDAMLTLASTIITLHNEQISETEPNSASNAESMCDAVIEIGNLLVNSMDSVSGDVFSGRVLFSQTNTFIGNGQDAFQQILNMKKNKLFFFVPYNITLGDDSVLTCGMILPKSLDREMGKELISEHPCHAVNEKAEFSDGGPVTESIRNMVQSMPGQQTQLRLQTPAEQIMHTNIVWAPPSQNIEGAMDQLQDTDAVCVLVGEQGSLDGIVTWIDLAGAASIYLQPMFRQWRRPADNATLQIKLSVVMTSPVCTVSPDTPLKTILEEMIQYRMDCIPVIDEDATVRGIVTTEDIFRMLLAEDAEQTV